MAYSYLLFLEFMCVILLLLQDRVLLQIFDHADTTPLIIIIRNTKENMFSEFQNMFKKKAEQITKSMPLDVLSQSQEQDYSKTPQKFTINGRQIVEKKLLAEGAFGFIWLAEDANTREQFALKRVICMTDDKFKSAMLQKNIMEKLPHSPFIVKYFGGIVIKHEGNTVVITLMELCSGGNLFDMLEKFQGKGIPEDTVKKIASSVLQGLSALHKAGFTHRDIKIENILIGKDRNMKICDFGSCTTEVIDFAEIPKSDYQHIKQKIEAFTTPMYRPPEIVDPYLKYKVSGKADIWMLGCVLYTMSYFTHPFVQASAVGISGAIYRYPQHPNQTPYKISQKMQDYIRNMLTPNPQHRPSQQKLLQILQKWQDLQSIPLNSQAKRLKKQQQDKELQLKKLNTKVSKYDGDIPMEELIRLQQKIVGGSSGGCGNGGDNAKFSFIKDRDTEAISHGGGSTIYKKQQKDLPTLGMQGHANSAIVNKRPTSNTAKINTQQKQPSNKNIDIWSSEFTNPKKPSPSPSPSLKNNNFDAFNDVFRTPKPTQTNPTNRNNININHNNFDQFFSDFQTPTANQSKQTSQPSKKNNQVNLLDL